MMLNYELALELKNAGFKGMVKGWFSPDGNGTSSGPVDGWEMRWFMPTIEELIEACGVEKNGDHFFIEHQTNWRAGFQAIYNESQRDIGQVAFGSAADEAVARLWLALNKK